MGQALSKRIQPASARPFLKWAGGKKQLLPELLPRIPQTFDRYFEPFIGGGALFFALQPEQAILSDINPDLINVYQVIQSDVESLIQDLKQHRHEKDYFYKLRSVDRTKTYKSWSPVRKASRLIYLNKTCFNGLFRVNSKGQFNTPFGSYKNPTIVDEANLRACSTALQTTQICLRSFERIFEDAKAEDFVYFDPPYIPLSTTASFTGYSKSGFNMEMQIKLRDVCLALHKRGTKFMVSNSSAPLIFE
ncbi:MAG: DNA adenine methylase, partial [Thermosynechococcaceae cyanobacterium]